MSVPQWEWVALGGFSVQEVGPPSRRRKILGIVEHVFMTERDARDAAKECGGSWVKRRRHVGRKVQFARGRSLA
jgi:hypothetical protein